MPRLVVARAAEGIDFYREVFGARELERHTTEDGHIVHAALALGDAVLGVTGAAPHWHNHDPLALGGSPVIFNVMVDDPVAVADEVARRGGEVIFPVRDHDYGFREGRVRDPFGHLWTVSKPIR